MPDKFGKTPTKVFESEDKYNECKEKEQRAYLDASLENG